MIGESSGDDVLSLEALLHPVDVGLALFEVLGRTVVRSPHGLTDKEPPRLDIILKKIIKQPNQN